MNTVIFSRTTAGIAIMLLAQLLRFFHYDLDDQTVQDLTQFLSDAGTLIGTAIALWGKVRSEKAKTAMADHIGGLRSQVVDLGATPLTPTPLVVKSVAVSQTPQ